MGVQPTVECSMGLHSQGLCVLESSRHTGPSLPWPTSLAALQRLLVAQQQLHVEGVTVLPEGNPRRVGQALGTAATVAYSSGRRGPCGDAGLRKWPRVLLGWPAPYLLLSPSGWVLTTVHSTHCPLQLGVTAGGAPGPIHIHIGTAPGLLGLPILPAHVAQWLL